MSSDSARIQYYMNKRYSCLVPHGKTLALCLLCGVTCPKPVKCMKQHCRGSRHSDNVRSMGYHGIGFAVGALFCRLCNVALKRGETVEYHIAREDHEALKHALSRTTDGEYIEYSDYLSYRSDSAFCEMCQLKLKCTASVFEEHLKTAEHRKEQLFCLKKYNGMVELPDNKLWCKLCSLEIDHDVDAVVKHVIREFGHMQLLMKLEDLIQDQGISIKKFLSDETETNAYCNRCDVKFVCNTKRIQCHIYTECHTLRVI